MTWVDAVGIWGAFSGLLFLILGVFTLSVVDSPKERRQMARVALASPLWPIVPLFLLVLMVRWATGGKP